MLRDAWLWYPQLRSGADLLQHVLFWLFVDDLIHELLLLVWRAILILSAIAHMISIFIVVVIFVKRFGIEEFVSSLVGHLFWVKRVRQGL